MNTTAWGDESIRRTSTGHLVYLIGISICPIEEKHIREAFTAVLPRNAAKLHWKDMNGKQRRQSLEIISEFAFRHYVAQTKLATHVNNMERARRKCLECLLPLLEQREAVERLVLETRDISQNRRDIAFIQAMRSRKFIRKLYVDIIPGPQDARLWIPDQILGAYGDSLNLTAEYDVFIATQVHAFVIDVA